MSGAVFTTAAAGVPLWQQARASRGRADAIVAAQRARAAMRVVMQDALDPFATLLLQLVTAAPEQKPLLRGAAIQLALTTIAQISEPGEVTSPENPRRLRVSYFALDPGPPRRLFPQAYAGRAGGPTVSLDAAMPAGQFLLLIADDGWATIDDIVHLPVPVWWDEEHQYRTFAAGPVAGPCNEPAGLLVVDALTPGELAALDLPLVRLLTHLLSLALQLLHGGAANPRSQFDRGAAYRFNDGENKSSGDGTVAGGGEAGNGRRRARRGRSPGARHPHRARRLLLRRPPPGLASSPRGHRARTPSAYPPAA
jgi:hypothetical protein